MKAALSSQCDCTQTFSMPMIASDKSDVQMNRECRPVIPHPESLPELRDRYHFSLAELLVSRGASRTEAEDLLADLWADCVPGPSDRPSLLEKFRGKCDLKSWFATVLTRRWIDLKRKQARRREVAHAGCADQNDDLFQHLPAPTRDFVESTILNLLHESLKWAFRRCAPDALVMLRLRYEHGVTQRELARMAGCHESQISRRLSDAMEQIQADTMSELKRLDPELKLSWQDFLDLCESETLELP